jgi:diguanylate cyclase (GGDEF)-like protein
MATRPSADELHRIFLEVIDQAVVAHVAVFDPITFEPPPDLPPGMGFDGDLRKTPIDAFMLVAAFDQPRLLGQQERIDRDGVVEDWIRFASGSEGRACSFDLSEQFGVQALVLSEEQTSPGVHVAPERPEPVGRLARWRVDSAGGALTIDPTLTKLMGWTAETIRAIASIDMIHVDDRMSALGAWAGMMSQPGASDRTRCRLLRADGTYLWVEMTFENHLTDPGDNSVHVEALDISGEMAAAEELRTRERLLHRLAEALPVGVLQIDADQRIVYANGGIGLITGRQGVETFAEQLQDVIDDDRTRAAQAIEQVLGTGIDGDIEITLVHKVTAEHRVCGLTLRALTEDDGSITGAIVCVSDVTDSASRRHDLEVAATFDTLTGTYNRTSCLAALEAALQRPEQPDNGCAVVFIDLDDFKAINDTLGHIAGDELLVETAQRLRAATRSADVVGRFGGDEFVVVCADVADAEMALELATRIHVRLSQPATIAGQAVEPTASLGVAWASGGTTADELLRRADVAMYVAKRDTAAGVHLYAETADAPPRGSTLVTDRDGSPRASDE